MNREQYKYLEGRINSAARVLRNNNPRDKTPPEVVRAEKIVQAWEKKRDALWEKNDEIAAKKILKAREALLFDDPKVAIAAVRKLEDEANAARR